MEAPTAETHATQVTRRYPALPSRVFEAWTNPDQLARWFAPSDEMTCVVSEFDAQPGGSYRIEMQHQAGNVYVVVGKFTEVSEASRLTFTWKWENEAMRNQPETTVSVKFAEIDGGTELTLTHDGFADASVAGDHGQGWSGCMWRLERLFGPSALHHDSVILALNRKLFTNALEGIADEELNQRRDDRTNSLKWLATHTAHNRAFIANLLGAEIESPFGDSSKPIEEVTEFPSIEDVSDFYQKVSGAIHARLSVVTDEALADAPPLQFPIADATVGGAIAFMVQHEAYHVGQMGLVRKALGYPAISYD